MNAFVILALDHLYLREYIMQLACYTKGKFHKKLKSCVDKCRGGSSFNQITWLRDSLKINDGLVLDSEGQITWPWLNVMFWRTFIAIFLHTLQILAIQSLALKLGVIDNIEISTRNDDIFDRPSDEVVTAFSFIKQPFFHKAQAVNAYKKRVAERKRRCFGIL
jgi:hypothetical protein